MSMTKEIVSYVLRSKYEDLPKHIVEMTKKNILDTLGVMIAGSSAPGLKELTCLVKSWGGEKESTVAVYGVKIPAPHAALVNCTMARARDFDAAHMVVPVHTHATIVPAGFILAEVFKKSKDMIINGKNFITATTIAADLHYRMRKAGGKENVHIGFTTNTFDPLVVAIMGSKIFGFGEEKIMNALGIAYAQCAGNTQAHYEGALTVRLQQGFGGMAGIFSVALADIGVEGAKRALDGEKGFYNVYMRGKLLPEAILNNLGYEFEESIVSTKLYPCCHINHAPISGALQLKNEYNINPNDIERVAVFSNQHAMNICGDRRSKVAPQTVPQAQFSIYYTVATALVKGKVTIGDFTEESMANADPRVMDLSKRVELIVEAKRTETKAEMCPIDLKIELKNGKTFAKHVEFPPGHPKEPIPFGEIGKKYKECADYSIRKIPNEKIDRTIEMVMNLEEINDVTDIIENVF